MTPKRAAPMLRWEAAIALERAHDFLARLGSREPALLSRIAGQLRHEQRSWACGRRASTLRDPVAAQALALELDVFEHLAFRRIDRERLALLDARAGQRLLDYGCGAGFYALNLALTGRHVTCVDDNELKISFIRTAARRLGIAHRIDFELAGTYDGVVCINVFDHLPDASVLVQELATRIAPGGGFFFYAHFTADGMHTSDPAVITRTFDTLAARFRLGAAQGPMLEWWIRKRAREPIGALLVPDETTADARSLARLYCHAHPELAIEVRGRQRVLTGPRFYLRPTAVHEGVLEILEQCDGTHTAAEIARHVARRIDRADCYETIRALWRRRYLSMSAKATARRDDTRAR